MKDGRVLITAPLGGNLRLLCGMMGTDFRPFLQADAADVAYAAPVSADEVALLLGAPGKRRIAFVSVRNGVLRREIPVPGGNATALAVSSSLKTIYYVAEDTIYSMPETGGPPVRLAEGEDLAIDPAGRMLVIHNSREWCASSFLQGRRADRASRGNAAGDGEPVPIGHRPKGAHSVECGDSTRFRLQTRDCGRPDGHGDCG